SPWTSESVALALGVPTPGRLAFTDVTTDTRHLKPGALFVALKGDRFDAHDFLADARTRGAAAAVVRRGTPRVDGLPVFEVADTLTALGLLARARRQRLPQGSPVVAITGSSGKTSTKEMIRAVLAREARRRTRTVVAGTAPEADVRPEAADLDDAGHPRITWGGGHSVTVPVLGFHQIENALLALAVGREAGVDPERAVAALAGVQIPGGRGTALERGGLTILDDTYNANPASLAWALKFAHWLAGRRRRPLAVVVGSMLELGDASDRL